MSNDHKKLTVFYSWQTDLPNNTNRGVILQALEAAGKQLQDDTKGRTSVEVGESVRPSENGSNSLKVTVDQATAGVPGSPHIAQTILEKIASADIFVADISTINSGTRNYRKTPNPNVLFELGYAVAHLGWERIILIQNSAVTRETDIPFDIRGHRFIPYSLPKKDSDETKKQKASLTSRLRSALLEISEANTPRPFERRGMSEQEIRRTRDRQTLASLFSHINIPILEKHLQDAPLYFHWIVARLRDEFDSIYDRATFHLYDESLKERIRKFAESWAASMPGEGTDYYRAMPSPYIQRFVSNEEAIRVGVLNESIAAYKQLQKGRDNFATELKSLLDYVRANYPEIDVEALGQDVGKSIHDSIRKSR
jgi:predicted nucleotide-binding protein with TIR-like domain